MNLLFSCIGKRGYIADYFRPHLAPDDQIIGTSNTHWTPGFTACDKGYLLPDISSDKYIPSLLELCQAESIAAILSFFDPDVVKLSEHLDAFRAIGVVPILPEPEIALDCFDKYRTYKFLTRNGFETASTYIDYHEAVSEIDAGRLSFPLYVKPRWGFGSQNTFVARSLKELDVFFHYNPDMLIQETLSGKAYDLEICNDLKGRVLAVVPWRKLRSSAGETEQAVTRNNPILMQLGQRLGEVLGHTGPLDADVFLQDGRTSILEINLRFGGGYPVSHFAGADFPGLIVDMIKGRSPAPRVGRFTAGVVMMKKLEPIGGRQGSFEQSHLRISGLTDAGAGE